MVPLSVLFFRQNELLPDNFSENLKILEIFVIGPHAFPQCTVPPVSLPPARESRSRTPTSPPNHLHPEEISPQSLSEKSKKSADELEKSRTTSSRSASPRCTTVQRPANCTVSALRTAPPPHPPQPCTAIVQTPEKQPHPHNSLLVTEEKTFMRIQKTEERQGSEVQEATLVSKVPTTETTRKNQPMLPVPDLRILKNKQEVHKTNKQQQMLGTNNRKQTTTTTSDDKTTTKTTASRVATIADLFKSKQQEHEKKQSQQTTKKTGMKTTTTTNNMEVKKQETPKAKKTIQKPTTTRKPNNSKLKQTLRQMWDKTNLNNSEQQDENKTTNENQTTTRETTTKMDNNKQQKPAIKDLGKKQAANKKVNKISDIEDLKLFLARKKLERATNGASKHTAVSSSTQPQNFLPSSARSSDSGGDRTSQTKPGMKNIAAKGKEFSAGTYDWVESTTRPGSTQ